MRLLFDQNLSHRLVALLNDLYPQSRHVRIEGFDQSTDSEIWEFARLQNLTIVTMDSDFAELASVRGVPPKIIWLRTGNIATVDLESRLRRAHGEIIDLDSSELSVLEIY